MQALLDPTTGIVAARTGLVSLTQGKPVPEGMLVQLEERAGEISWLKGAVRKALTQGTLNASYLLYWFEDFAGFRDGGNYISHWATPQASRLAK